MKTATVIGWPVSIKRYNSYVTAVSRLGLIIIIIMIIIATISNARRNMM